METNTVGKIKNEITSKLAGFPEQSRKYITALNKVEQNENQKKNEKHFIDFLKNKKDLVKIYNLIKNNKISVREKRKQIKDFLKEPEKINDFFNSVLKFKYKHRQENNEATDSGSAGGYESLFSEPEQIVTKGQVVKTVREQIEKVEAKEATSSTSSGQYNQPAIWAKSMSKKNWKGAKTKYMPGAKRVQVKKKCKIFPYCNQGDINSIKIFESESVQNAIDSVSRNYQLDKKVISKIIFNEIIKRQK